MAFFAGRTTRVDLHHHHRQIISPTPKSQADHSRTVYYVLFLYSIYSRNRNRRFSTSNESTPSEFSGQNAYVLLRVSENSSFAEIKASFRKLAKETHPDLAQSLSDSNASQRFIQILAAYEILSDSEKRAHYDRYLLSQRMVVKRHVRQGSMMYTYESNITATKQMEVVEWLKWYRDAISDILSEKKVVVGSDYFDVLERDFYSAIHAAYYGPVIETMDFLPQFFEAEERSACGIPEVLHLVSGRDLFGMVRIADEIPELPPFYSEKLTSFTSGASGLCQSIENVGPQFNSGEPHAGIHQMRAKNTDYHKSDAYKDLELHVSGRMVAVATRVPPKSCRNGVQNGDSQDHIHVYLSSHEDPTCTNSGFRLGTVTGLGTNAEEGQCSVYNSSGAETHMIMKHRTLLVKHMHWYQLGDKVSVCECRCSRARLPPSKFWLFEPRCGMHDIGGWYVETFGRDKKGRTVPSQRYWDGFDANDLSDKRLHPAMYLLTLGYRTLDLEDARRRKQKVRDIVGGKMIRVISWCKKLV